MDVATGLLLAELVVVGRLQQRRIKLGEGRCFTSIMDTVVVRIYKPVRIRGAIIVINGGSVCLPVLNYSLHSSSGSPDTEIASRPAISFFSDSVTLPSPS